MMLILIGVVAIGMLLYFTLPKVRLVYRCTVVLIVMLTLIELYCVSRHITISTMFRALF